MHKKSVILRNIIRFSLLSIFLPVFTGCLTTHDDPAGYVNPLIDTKSPRWLYFSSACRPYGLVSLSPDTWVYGTWNSGYLYDTTTIRCHAGVPWLTQYWLRRLKDEVFSDITPYGGYNGDEDQGQIGGFGVLTSIGLFDITGGASTDPYYEITSPVFDRITIHLDNRYYQGKAFVIKTINNSPENIYIQSSKLNNKTLNSFRIPHTAITNGGVLEIVLSDKPSKWGIENN